MVYFYSLRSLTLTALALMLILVPIAWTMENVDEQTNEATNAPVPICKIENFKDFLSKHRRGIVLVINGTIGVCFLIKSFDQNNAIYDTNNLWQIEWELLHNCTCGPVQAIHSDVVDAAFYSNISSAFAAVSTAGKLLSLICHCWIGDTLAPHFNMAFIVSDAVVLSTGSLTNSHLWRAKDLFRSTMPAFLGSALKKAVETSYYLAIPAGQLGYQFFESCYDCFTFCKREPIEEEIIEEDHQSKQDE